MIAIRYYASLTKAEKYNLSGFLTDKVTTGASWKHNCTHMFVSLPCAHIVI